MASFHVAMALLVGWNLPQLVTFCMLEEMEDIAAESTAAMTKPETPAGNSFTTK